VRARRQRGPRALYAHDELRGATALGVGHSHACAVLGNGETRCWGADYQGQLGNGRREDVHTHELRGVPVVGVPRLTSVAAGELETCGLTATGEMWCWGHDERK
jgi:alpha-tubulin suppressor-like RCC1 family protein